MRLSDQASLLCRAIEKKGRAEAEKILSGAREKAARIVRDSEDEVRMELERRVGEKRQVALRQARQLEDGAKLQAGQQLLQAKEALFAELLSASRQQLTALSEGSEYPAILQSLILQAVATLPGEPCRVQVRKQDQALVDTPSFKEVLLQQSKRKVEIMTEAADIIGGCLVYSFDRRMLVDFSFAAILSRAQPRLRELMAGELPDETGP